MNVLRSKSTSTTCHCEERSDVAIRFSLGTVRIGTCCKGNGLPRQCAHWLAMTGGGTFPHSCHCEERSDVAIRFSLGTVRIGTCGKGNGLPHQRARWFAMTVVVGTLAEPSYVRALHLRSRGPKDVRLPPKVRNAFAAGLAR